MISDQIKQDITKWVVDFVEKSNPLLNGWAPCPYARKARVDGKFDMGSFDVIAYVYPGDKFTAEAFNNLVNNLNDWHLIPRGMLALADHPADIESINGVTMNQGQYAICFLQNLQKLNDHAKMLADKGFYNGWPEDYLTGLFRGRKDPRA